MNPSSSAESVADWCATHGGGRAFLVPGATIDPLVEACHAHPGVEIVLCTHESGAGYAADGFARMRDGPALVLAIGGPGLTNLVSPLATAVRDRVPLLVVTGGVPSDSTDTGLFQDAAGTDVAVGLAIGIDSHAVATGHDLVSLLGRARDPERGPMHLLLPLDLQRAAPVREASVPTVGYARSQRSSRLATHVASAERPLLLVGDGARPHRGAVDAVLRTGLDVMTTHAAADLAPRDRSNAHGPFGYAGRPSLTGALRESPPDLLLAVGTLPHEDPTDTGVALRPSLGRTW